MNAERGIVAHALEHRCRGLSQLEDLEQHHSIGYVFFSHCRLYSQPSSSTSHHYESDQGRGYYGGGGSLPPTSGRVEADVRPTVYTDGCCFNNGRPGASAGIGVFWGRDNPQLVHG